MTARHVRPCPACLASDSRPIGVLAGFWMQACRDCGSLFTDRVPAAADYTDYYHAGNLEVPAFVHRQLDHLAESFEPRRHLNRWLDVGCGAGALMSAARQRGWEVVGTEVAEGAADAVRAQGFDVRFGELDQLGLPEGSHDLVSVVEVIEHVPDPRSMLATAQRLLRPGGVLYLTTPHGRGVSARLLGTGWSVLSPPEHLQLFSARGLRIATRDAGLSVLSLDAHAVNPSELIHAAKSRGKEACPPGSRVESSYALNESLTSNRAGAVLKRAANATLTATGLGDTLKLLAVR